MGSHTGCQETTAEAANKKRQATGSASSNTRRTYRHSSRIKQRQGFPKSDQNEHSMASESSGRIPELKTMTAVSSSTSGTGPTGSQTSSLLVSQHPLLCSLLSSPPPQQLVVTPR